MTMPTYRDPRELRLEAERLRATAGAIEDGIWQLACEGKVMPSQLVERLGISLSGANHRLKDLYNLGLLNREKVNVPTGGRAFAYSVRVER